MKTTLCTLYNSLYLDKGLVLYDSLKKCCEDFVLYVLCMDDKCYDVIKDMGEKEMIPIKLEEFEDESLLNIKTTRSFGEYCWTCTPSIILYIIEKYNEPICTYIDADMYFYHDPQVLIDEMLLLEKSVLIVPHRFTNDKKYLERNGIYCVEFNTFLNREDSLSVLKQWREDCIECCTSVNDGIHFGDQKYLDGWPSKYGCVYICSNPGAGIAPWNVASYKDINKTDMSVKYLISDKRVPIVFYHFQSLTYLTHNIVSTGIGKHHEIDKDMIETIYRDYLKEIERIKLNINKKYGVDIRLIGHPAFKTARWRNVLKSFKFIRILRYCFSLKRINYCIKI